MPSLTLLNQLLEQAEAQRDAAQAGLRHAQEQQRRAEQQEHQLKGYQGEFDARWTERFRANGHRELIDCRQAFGERLQEAIRLQHREADAHVQRTERARGLLLQREQRVAAVRKLIERRAQDQAQLLARRDQRQTDEAAAQQLLRRARG